MLELLSNASIAYTGYVENSTIEAQCIENSMMEIYLRRKLSVEEVLYFGLSMMVVYVFGIIV